MTREAYAPNDDVDTRTPHTAAHDGSVAVTAALAALPAVALAAVSYPWVTAAIGAGIAVGVAMS